ncbi:MAG: phosphodiester glycosidase family protein [Fimbriimonas sp.]
MRLISCLLVSLSFAVVFAQKAKPVIKPQVKSWEKPIAPGLSYRMEFDPAGPFLIHVLRFSPQSPAVRARPELGTGVVYRDDPTRGRRTVSEMVEQNRALAGINGDFFPFTGDPLGLMVRNGELTSKPYPRRSAVAWGNGPISFGVPTLTARILSDGLDPIAIDGVNEDCGDNGIVLNTTTAGLALAKAPCVAVVLRVGSAIWSPSSAIEGTVEVALPDAIATPLQPGQAILLARGNKVGTIAALRPGSRVRIEMSTAPFNWEKMDQAVGGGPMLVRGGRRISQALEEGFNVNISDARHPRTAVGKTAQGDLLFVAVDGRQKISAGLTLAELGDLMVRLGCVEAMNLDGGGSTTLNIRGITVNRPSGGAERAVANAVLFSGPQPKNVAVGQKIIAPTEVGLDQPVTLKLQDPRGREVPSSEVIWVATGAAWIDQGGQLNPTDLGEVQVVAWSNGETVRAKLTVQVAVPRPVEKEVVTAPKPTSPKVQAVVKPAQVGPIRPPASTKTGKVAKPATKSQDSRKPKERPSKESPTKPKVKKPVKSAKSSKSPAF